MKKEVIDHLGRKVQYSFPPQRIVCLCPGITETLYALNLDEQIVGRTRYCKFPEEKIEKASIVGGIKDVDEKAIAKLNPDLIIVEKEENTKEILETLEKDYPVYSAQVESVTDALKMIEDISKLVDREKEGKRLIEEIKQEFTTLPNMNGKKAAYFIWRNPYMAVGKNTYINSILETMGFVNPFTKLEGRYPVITEKDFVENDLDYIFLASEPYAFKKKHLEEFLNLSPKSKVRIIDGEMFWYGAKMKIAAGYFREYVKSL